MKDFKIFYILILFIFISCNFRSKIINQKFQCDPYSNIRDLKIIVYSPDPFSTSELEATPSKNLELTLEIFKEKLRDRGVQVQNSSKNEVIIFSRTDEVNSFFENLNIFLLRSILPYQPKRTFTNSISMTLFSSKKKYYNAIIFEMDNSLIRNLLFLLRPSYQKEQVSKALEEMLSCENIDQNSG